MSLTEEQKRRIESGEEIEINQYVSDNYICTVCGYLGNPKNNTRGSFVIEVVLWLFLIIPGLIYSLWRITNKYRGYPKCNSTAIIPLETPKGQEIYKSLHFQKKSKGNIIDSKHRALVREESRLSKKRCYRVSCFFGNLCTIRQYS